MIVNETVDKLVEDSMRQAANNIEFLKDCMAIPSFNKLNDRDRECTEAQLEYYEERFEHLKQYFSLPEKLDGGTDE